MPKQNNSIDLEKAYSKDIIENLKKISETVQTKRIFNNENSIEYIPTKEELKEITNKLNNLEKKIESLTDKIDKIFGPNVLINGKFYDIGPTPNLTKYSTSKTNIVG